MQDATECIKFLFTKMTNDKESKKKLKVEFNDIKDNGLNEDDQSDVNFMLLFDHLVDSVDKIKHVKVIDPLE